MTDQKSNIWQFKQHEVWVKTVLISDIVEPSWRVCEFCCGKGLDLGRWQRAKISHFPNYENIEETKERWVQKNKPFTADFIMQDPMVDDLSTVLPSESFNVVTSFDGLQFSFESEAKPQSHRLKTERCTRFIQNVAGCLKRGGFFFGLVPDSSAIWDRAQHKAARASASEQKALFSIDFPSDYNYPHFGSSYVLRLEDPLHRDSTEFLVHFPSLIRICAEFGLEMLEISNLIEFFEDNKRNYHDRLKELKVIKDSSGKLEPLQRDLIGPAAYRGLNYCARLHEEWNRN